MKRALSLLLWMLVPFITMAQTAPIDSLKALLAKTRPDTNRVVILTALAYRYKEVSSELTLQLALQARQLAQTLSFPKGQSKADLGIAVAYRDLGRLPESVKFALEARQIASGLQDQRLQAETWFVLGLIYSPLDPRQSIANTQKAIRLYQLLPHQSAPDSLIMANAYANMMPQYMDLNQLDSASYVIQEASRLLHLLPYSVGREQLQQQIYRNTGQLEHLHGHYQNALVLFHKALQLQEQTFDVRNRTSTHMFMAEVFEKTHQPDSSLYYARLALAGSRQAYRLRSPSIYFLLARLHRSLNNRDSAQYYQEQGYKANERLYGREKYQQLNLLLLNDQQRQFEAVAVQKAFEQNIRLYSMVAGLVTMFLIAFLLYQNNRQKQKANGVLNKTLTELRNTQTQLIQREKMASLGELTAGIAHEIQNPLNFVNNFSELSTELVEELKSPLTPEGGIPNGKKMDMDLFDDLTQNLQKIVHHGQRASSIVKGMLEHSRTSTGQKEPTDLNTLADEYLRLAYQGQRSKGQAFTCQLITDFTPSLPLVDVAPQEIGRVLLNLYTNAFYAVGQRGRGREQEVGYQPTLWVSTHRLTNSIEIRVRDNGTGISESVKAKIFQPFFTTKPTGEGTGLGLSLSYDIVTKGHGGELTMESEEGLGTEFIIGLPVHPVGS